MKQSRPPTNYNVASCSYWRRICSRLAQVGRAACVGLGAIFIAASVLLRAASPEPIAGEMLGDPAFELSTANGTFPDHAWQAAWAWIEAGAVCTRTAGRTGHGLWAYTGPKPIEWWSGTYQEFPAEAGRIYRASAWIRTPPGESWVEGSRALIRLLFLDASGGILASFESPAITAPQPNWEQLEALSSPATSAVAKVRFVCYLEKPQVWGQSVCNFDDTSLTSNKPSPAPTGTGIFNPGPSLGDGGRKVAIADLNHDGHLDIVTGTGTNLVWITDGHGRFTSTGQDFGGASSWALAAVDADGDMNIDLLLYRDHEMQLWLGDGKGLFRDSGERIGYGIVRHAFTADVDGNGTPDVVLACELLPCLVFLNDGHGHFSDSGQLLGEDTNRSYGGAAIDADGDGDVDLVFANLDSGGSGPGALHLFINDGHGHFTERGSGFGTPGAWYRAVAVGDLDGDEQPDLCVGSYTEIEIWRNDKGQFIKVQELASWASPWDVALVDVDHDGDLDAVTAQYAAQPSISELLLNDGKGRFLNSGRHLCCAQSLGIAVGDLDEDGSPDIVLAGPRDYVRFNQSMPPAIKSERIADGKMSGRVSNIELPVWGPYFKVYAAAYIPTRGWSTPQGCDASPFTPVETDGTFVVNGIPEEATRIVVALAPTGANVSHLPCLDNAQSLPPELDILGLAKMVIDRARLTLAVEFGRVFLRWPADNPGATLECASEISGPWSEVSVTTPGEFSVPRGSSSAFFRLR